MKLSSLLLSALVVVPPAIHALLLRLRAPHLAAGLLRDDLELALAEARNLVAQPG